jgi:choline dehydrogenase-like flavoprotein
MFNTEPEPGLNGRALNYPRGKVIGGCSAINAMIYMRGQAADYDHWRQLGLTGWGWNDVLPFFRKQSDHFLGDSEHHGIGGEWRIEAPRVQWELLDAFRKAAEEYGIVPIDDFNRGDNEGSCYFHVNQRRGRRWSSKGVTWRQDGAAKTARAKGEVILSAGSIGSAQLLLLSGVGPGRDLLDLGIPVVLDRPGVGQNLQDHLQLRMIYKVSGVKTLNETYHSLLGRAAMGLDYALRRRGPLTMAPSQLGVFTRSDPSRERANIQFHVQPLSLDKFGDPLHTYPAFTTSVCNLQPQSRGFVRLRSADPADKPVIQPRYLSADEDRQVAADSIRVARNIVAQPALQKFKPVETLPGEQVSSDDEPALAKAAGDIGTTIFHPVGTAKMGLTSDPDAVVDARLRVLGIEGLRVIDASVMPTITSGNTNSPTMMIAEKGAEMVLADQTR